MFTDCTHRELRNLTELTKLNKQLVVIKSFVPYNNRHSTFIVKLDNVMSLLGLPFDQSEVDHASSPICER